MVDFIAARLAAPHRSPDSDSRSTAPCPAAAQSPPRPCGTAPPSTVGRPSQSISHSRIRWRFRCGSSWSSNAVRLCSTAQLLQGRLRAFELEAHPEFGVGGQALEPAVPPQPTASQPPSIGTGPTPSPRASRYLGSWVLFAMGPHFADSKMRRGENVTPAPELSDRLEPITVILCRQSRSAGNFAYPSLS